MFCRYCGKELNNEAVACLQCGCDPKKGDKFCPNCGAATSSEQIVCVKCGSSLKQSTSSGATGKNHSMLSFSFSGRINRAKFWGGGIIIGVIAGIIGGIFGGTMAHAILSGDTDAIVASLAGSSLVALLAIIFLAIPGLSLQVRRLHDLNQSGWFVVLFWVLQFIPIVGFFAWLWPFIWLGCMKGTDGPNNYGPDPLAQV